MSFDRKSGNTRQIREIREIENDNFVFTEKVVVLSFNRKSGFFEIENDNFYFTDFFPLIF